MSVCCLGLVLPPMMRMLLLSIITMVLGIRRLIFPMLSLTNRVLPADGLMLILLPFKAAVTLVLILITCLIAVVTVLILIAFLIAVVTVLILIACLIDVVTVLILIACLIAVVTVLILRACLIAVVTVLIMIACCTAIFLVITPIPFYAAVLIPIFQEIMGTSISSSFSFASFQYSLSFSSRTVVLL